MFRDPKGTLADAVLLTKLGAYQYTGDDTDSPQLLGMLEAAGDYRHTEELALFGAALSNE